MALAPPWAFTAEALFSETDAHLVRAVHVRALPSPRAGVPATPLFVSRAFVNADRLAGPMDSDDVAWRDDAGNLLTPPFDVTPDRPVTALLPRRRCILVAVTARPFTGHVVRVDALVNSPQGPAVVGTRLESPYVLGAGRIDMVRVSGGGRVLGLTYLTGDVVEEFGFKPWRIWSLPVEPTARYTPTPDAVAEAKDRVLRGAPVRTPLYVEPSAVSPAAASPATPNDAFARVDTLEPDLSRWLDRLLNDLTVRPNMAIDEHGFNEVTGTLSVPIEPHVLATAVDPDLGHWLGFGDVDDAFDDQQTMAVLYLVRGLFRWDMSLWDNLQLPAIVPFVQFNLATALAAFPEVAAAGVVPPIDDSYLDLTALAVAVRFPPPDRPDPPAIDGFEDRGWLAVPPPPDVRRIVRIRGSGFGAHALAALAATDAGGLRSLHPLGGSGGTTPLSLTITEPEDAAAPGHGRFDDRHAPEGPVDYQVAQGDWFGRWSEWTRATAPAKARALPLAPVLELLYAPPTFPDGVPLPSTPAAGTLTIRVPVPRPTDLPAGGNPLASLGLDLTVDGTTTTPLSFTLGALGPGAAFEANPSPGHDTLIVTLPGPAIPRAGSRHASAVARWRDASGAISPDGARVGRTLLDPRPPELPPVPTTLLYSARPDATGYARVELEWPSVPGTRYRVFASTETILLGALRNAGEAATVDAILAAQAGAPRASVLRANKGRFGWDAFESVTEQPIVAAGAVTRFVHRVSGALDVLAVYRVLSEGASGVLAEMTEADLIVVGVPNLGPPSQPLVGLEALPDDHEVDGVALRVRVPPARAVPIAWRLRRASVPTKDALGMQVVLTGSIPATATTAAGTEFTITDPTPLARWRQYRWVVEVQAGPPPGAPEIGPIPAGEWSEASAPATVAVIPPDDPAPPGSVVAAASATPGEVTVTIDHPDADRLIGTALGSYRFEVYRASAAERPTRLEIPVVRGAGTTFVATDASSPVAGSRWAVRLVDPIGRRSASVVSNEV